MRTHPFSKHNLQLLSDKWMRNKNMGNKSRGSVSQGRNVVQKKDNFADKQFNTLLPSSVQAPASAESRFYLNFPNWKQSCSTSRTRVKTRAL